MVDKFLFCASDGPFRYGLSESADLCPVMAVIVVESTPAWARAVIVVTRIQWLVYILERLASSEIFFIIVSRAFLPNGLFWYQVGNWMELL